MGNCMDVKAKGKHAYLIIAHKADETFFTLLRMLDHENNDIFIHMDVKNETYSPEETLKSVKTSKVYHSSRTNITWGGGIRKSMLNFYY